uniref:Pentatricopeptide repeat-containing protein At4g33990 isoform X1 n=1 Tax=Tanacetum cinerariifolium TaxID=118510 RepID=A0A699JCY2_TANCI|nr:pentatricopeptide repeat-containing protein At4g33990 isoform X1 [Tanacetum cinerariifolium]
MISAYVRNNIPSDAINCLYKMLTYDVNPDFYTFPPVLKACRNTKDGTRIHCWILKSGLEWDVFVAASLVHMYCRFDLFDSAYQIFSNMPARDMGCWNAIILGFCQNGKVDKAVNVLDEMKFEGIKMDSITVSTVLPVYAQMDDMLQGRLLHLYVINHGLDSDLFVSNAFVNFYAKFGEVEQAQKIFDNLVTKDLVSWNSIIAAYEHNHFPDCAVDFFCQMQMKGFKPDLLTLVSIASSIAQSRDSSRSKCVHGFILRRCWFDKDVIIGNTVVDMYGQNGLASEAIEVYRMMVETASVTPNQGTWASIIPAYAHIRVLKEGATTYGKVLKNGLLLNVFIGTCLVDLYGKCGQVEDAMLLFYEVPRTSSVPWNAVISSLGIHGHGEKSLQLFRNMLDERAHPHTMTFISLLSACSHSGLVEQGECCINVMQKEYGIKPGLKHYGVW